MREIKFRGKTIDTNEWVYGNYVYSEEDGRAFIYTTGYFGSGTYEVIPETAGQFLGRQDKNKIDIYRGDIVECSMSFKGGVLPHRGEIVYDKFFGAFATKNQSGTTLLHNHCLYTLEVIGNMTDNKELLS